MSNKIINSTEYNNWVKELREKYLESRLKAASAVNSELVHFYWLLGKDINEKSFKNTYGSNFFEKLSKDIQEELPDEKGLSPVNLRYAYRFYSLYSNNEILPQPVEEFSAKLFLVPWGHHRIIIDKLNKEPEKAIFYINKTIENGWSRAVLLNMLDTNLYETSGKSINNFKTTLPAVQSELAKEIIKNPYNFDFLSLREDYKERELQEALENNILKYLMELGKGFAFYGRQVRLEVNGDEYFCDQLFYHTKLHCYIVVELKITKFEPEFVSKLNFYCNAVNHLIKGKEDNDTIGLLICKEKNDIVAQWTVEKSKEPIAITKYELKNLLEVKE